MKEITMKKIPKTKINVILHTKDGQTHWGYIMLDNDERLQDVMNDERKFVPCFILKVNKSVSSEREDEYKMKIVSKDFINILEEN